MLERMYSLVYCVNFRVLGEVVNNGQNRLCCFLHNYNVCIPPGQNVQPSAQRAFGYRAQSQCVLDIPVIVRSRHVPVNRQEAPLPEFEEPPSYAEACGLVNRKTE